LAGREQQRTRKGKKKKKRKKKRTKRQRVTLKSRQDSARRSSSPSYHFESPLFKNPRLTQHYRLDFEEKQKRPIQWGWISSNEAVYYLETLIVVHTIAGFGDFFRDSYRIC
jgi:hypothetical protein